MPWLALLSLAGEVYSAIAKKPSPVSGELLTTAGNLIVGIQTEAKRSGEMTPEEEAAFDAKFEQITSAPHWQPLPKG